jgi:hypothetical protein
MDRTKSLFAQLAMSPKTSAHRIVKGCKASVLYKTLDVPDQALLIALSYHPL